MSNPKSKQPAMKFEVSGEKTPFNKKKWREEKYSVKARVKKWEEKRKKTLLSKYQKELKKSGISVNNPEANEYRKKMTPLKRAQLKYQQIQKQKQKEKEERERVKKERNEALKAYKEKKAARFKKLSQKTSRGQPLMKGRIELLLEKIEKDYANHDS